MKDIQLPPRIGGGAPPKLPGSRQVTIVGANGAGKTRFMRELQARCKGRAYFLSALNASFPERSVSALPGSIDEQYAECTRNFTYLKADAVSELDKLCYLLFADEFKYLLGAKTANILNDGPLELKPTKLDQLILLWERIFPGNQILRHSGKWMFKTDAGDNIISAATLSQGEKAVLYYIAATLYAMPGAVIFIESPSLFLHPSILNTLWNSIENLRPDCTFVYNSVDVDFVNSRTENVCLWIKSFDVEEHAWDYEVLQGGNLSDDIFVDLIGSRKPVLFIEGDAVHSIDAKLYTLVFSEYTVRPLGSCNKVIESTRSFNDLQQMHHLDSRGIVDRDRRTPKEVDYLRMKNIFVPDVAEVENLFLLERVVKVMAKYRHKDPERVFEKVRHAVMSMFADRYTAQALQHVRHKVKRDVECKIDAKFTCITALETHVKTLINKLRPRQHYEQLLKEFEAMLRHNDYAGVLKVFNHKPILPDSHVAELLGYATKEEYIRGVLSVLKGATPLSRELREAIKACFHINPDGSVMDIKEEKPEPAEAPAERKGEKMETIAEKLARQERMPKRRQKHLPRYMQEPDK